MKVKEIPLEPWEGLGCDPFDVSRWSDGNRRRREIMRRVMEHELTQKQRRSILLYYGQGLSTVEVGRRMGIGKSSVSKLMSRGRAKIKKHLEYAGEKGNLHFFS